MIAGEKLRGGEMVGVGKDGKVYKYRPLAEAVDRVAEMANEATDRMPPGVNPPDMLRADPDVPAAESWRDRSPML